MLSFKEIIALIKDLNSTKFYVILFTFVIYMIAVSYKDVMYEEVINMRAKRLEFFECRDLKGLESKLNQVYVSNASVKSYTVYIYQPKDKAIYKTCLTTNDQLVKTSPKIYGVYLKDQPKLNKKLNESVYTIVDENNPDCVEIPMDCLGFKFALVYRLNAGNKNIGEVVIGFKKFPEVTELDSILKELNTVTYSYII